MLKLLGDSFQDASCLTNDFWANAIAGKQYELSVQCGNFFLVGV